MAVNSISHQESFQMNIKWLLLPR